MHTQRLPDPASRDGMVLVLTVMVLAVLIVLGYAYAFNAGVSRRATLNAREAFLRAADRESVLAYAVALLEADGRNGETDTLEDPWAQELLVRSPDGRSYTVRIRDEESKLNINAHVLRGRPEQNLLALERAVLAAGGTPEDVEHILGLATDQHPIPCMDGLRRSGLLPGALFEGRDGKPPLDELLATHPAWVNVNTASEEVLEALWQDAARARAVLEHRQTAPFTSRAEVQGLLQAEGEAEQERWLLALLDIESRYFRIRIQDAEAVRVPGALEALVERSGDRVRILRVREGGKGVEP